MRPIIEKQGKSKRGKFTAEQSRYISRCIDAGCIVCAIKGNINPFCQWHHQKENYHAAAMRAPHEKGLSLCYDHHLGNRGIHTHKTLWLEDAGMSEAELVNVSQRLFHWQG